MKIILFLVAAGLAYLTCGCDKANNLNREKNLEMGAGGQNSNMEIQNQRPFPEMHPQVGIQGMASKLSDKNAVKASVPLAITWLEFHYEGKAFMFCTSEYPSYTAGNLGIVLLKGWIFLDYANRWQPLLEVLTYGEGKLSFDKETGELLLLSSVNNRLKDLVILSYNLKVTAR